MIESKVLTNKDKLVQIKCKIDTDTKRVMFLEYLTDEDGLNVSLIDLEFHELEKAYKFMKGE